MRRLARKLRGCIASDVVVDRLTNREMSEARLNNLCSSLTHLSPRDIRCDYKLYVTMSEYPEDDPPNVPLHDTTPSFKQSCGLLFLSMFIFTPRELTVTTRLRIFQMIQFRAFVRRKSRKNENGFDVKFFKDAKVLFDSLNER